jgi:hypothetical protein
MRFFASNSPEKLKKRVKIQFEAFLSDIAETSKFEANANYSLKIDFNAFFRLK